MCIAVVLGVGDVFTPLFQTPSLSVHSQAERSDQIQAESICLLGQQGVLVAFCRV